MKPTLHILTIENRRTDDTVIHGFDYPALRAQVADYCRKNWSHSGEFSASLPAGVEDPMPEDEDILIEAHFSENDREFLIEQSFELDLPQPHASATEMLDLLTRLAATEPDQDGDIILPSVVPDDEDDDSRSPAERALVDAVRSAIAAAQSERSDTSPPAWNPESHWDHYPAHPTEDWTDAVISGGTRLGYVAWVNVQLTDS